VAEAEVGSAGMDCALMVREEGEMPKLEAVALMKEL
jgi:hypothetical protein